MQAVPEATRGRKESLECAANASGFEAAVRGPLWGPPDVHTGHLIFRISNAFHTNPGDRRVKPSCLPTRFDLTGLVRGKMATDEADFTEPASAQQAPT